MPLKRCGVQTKPLSTSVECTSSDNKTKRNRCPWTLNGERFPSPTSPKLDLCMRIDWAICCLHEQLSIFFRGSLRILRSRIVILIQPPQELFIPFIFDSKTSSLWMPFKHEIFRQENCLKLQEKVHEKLSLVIYNMKKGKTSEMMH